MFKMNFLKMRTNSALKKNRAMRTSIPYKQAQSIGIIFTVEDKQKHHDIKEFVHRLEQEGKKVQVLEFLPEKKENHEFLFDFFTIKDFSYWGKLQSDKAVKFAETPFDFLFYFDNQANPLVLDVLARSKARCRVGKYSETDRPFFELMIEQNGTTNGLIETMHKYTQKIR